MGRDAEKKRTLLSDWWREFLPLYSVCILTRGTPLNKEAVLKGLQEMPAGCPSGLSVYILFSETVPVYIGKADVPLQRWCQHLDGWILGKGSYAKWRKVLLDEEGLARTNLSLLVVPATAITRPAIPAFPTTIGSIEYQLVGLAEDAYPGCLLNHEGKGR